jgi:hypothetical protein
MERGRKGERLLKGVGTHQTGKYYRKSDHEYTHEQNDVTKETESS